MHYGNKVPEENYLASPRYSAAIPDNDARNLRRKYENCDSKVKEIVKIRRITESQEQRKIRKLQNHRTYENNGI